MISHKVAAATAGRTMVSVTVCPPPELCTPLILVSHTSGARGGLGGETRGPSRAVAARAAQRFPTGDVPTPGPLGHIWRYLAMWDLSSPSRDETCPLGSRFVFV